MSIDGGIDRTVSLLDRTLDRASLRGSIVAANVANVDTPGYRALQVVFDDVLAAAGGLTPLRTDPAHMSAGPPGGAHRFVEGPLARIRPDGNSVDVDREMTALAALQGRYSAAAEMLKKRFGLLEYAVTSGGHR